MATEITVWFGFWLESCAARHCGETCQECQADQRSEVRGFCLFFLFLLLLFFLLLFFLLFFFLNILWRSFTSLLIFRGLWISSLLAWTLTEPLGQAGLGSLGPVFVLLLPHGLKVLSSDDLPATFVQLLSVVVGSGVGTSLVLGVHTDLGWVLASESLGVETLLEGLLSELNLLSLLEFVVLGHTSLLKVVFVSLKLNNDVEEILSFSLELIRVHGIEIQGLDFDGEGDLHLLVELLLGLGHLFASVGDSGAASGGAGLLGGSSLLLLGLLGLEHLLALSLGLFHSLLLFLGLLGLLLGLFLSDLFLFFLLLHGELLLLFSSDLLPLAH